jgi:hypothetical protein
MFSELVLLRAILSYFFCGQGVPLRYFSRLKLMLSGQIKTLLDRQEELYEQQAQLKALLEVSKKSRNKSNYESSVTQEDWSGSFPWDSQADDTRFNVFGITSYRSNQREVSLQQK